VADGEERATDGEGWAAHHGQGRRTQDRIGWLTEEEGVARGPRGHESRRAAVRREVEAVARMRAAHGRGPSEGEGGVEVGGSGVGKR
jgi:hypothetical protein